MVVLLIGAATVGWTIGCAKLADHKGRNVVGWGVAGFCFGIFALVVLALLSSLEDVAYAGSDYVSPGGFNSYEDVSYGSSRYLG